ncbi:hypothetical protein BJF79_18470 [Actinomadura sp. CNU-125]|uniref:hypothetical protein n=1 Tax=Actinomadura sp. CNU-125 TaxID=1904961 RepID=UPI00095CDA2A|nr:hypothetical protein [Actinomadura sp. CNU-125]OLT16048.1 hypothetical protein BJF79_18470 [Actinomadura sp. CNU-125]
MTEVLLTLHVLAAILAIGPVSVAGSLFPRYAREGNAGVMALLHRICRNYALVGVAVPVFGFATGATLGVLTQAWLLASIAATAAAAALLVFAVLPAQGRVLAGEASGEGAAGRLAMTTGIFNLLWTIVAVLMVVRPGA